MKKILWIILMLPALAFAQAVLPTSWNFSTPGVSTPPTGWTYGVGTNGNLTYAFGKNDAISGRLDASGEHITINFADKPGDVSFYLSPQNAGNAWGGQFDVQESADGQNWTTIHSVTTKATTATNFNDPIISKTLNQNSRWVRFFFTTKLPGGNPNVPGGNMAVDLVTITPAPPPAIQMVLKQNTTTLVNGNTFVYGNAAKQLFTVQNNGTASDLKIDSLKMSGDHAADFSFGMFDSFVPFNGGTDTFAVHFMPSGQGSKFANVTVYTNDAERSPFVIKLYAIGGQFATEPVFQSSSLSISNVTTHALNVTYGGSADAEKYIVLRKPINFIGETPQDGSTYQKGDYIGGAQVAYVGPDTAMLKPNYILANTQYTFSVFVFNGPDGFQNYKTNNAPSQSVTTPGGLPGTYYNGINPSLPSFITDLHNKIKVIDTIFYSSYASVMVNGYLSRDTTAGKKVVTCVYTNDQYVYAEPFGWWTGQGGNTATLTREHTFAQSWMPTNGGPGSGWPDAPNGKEYLEFNDLHNLFPTNQTTANVKRSNFPFGLVVNVTYVSPTGSGKLGTDVTGNTVYEPKDDQKGDLARALFYMLVRFNGVNNTQWRLPSSQDINLLLQWHTQDPPSDLEIARNQYISTTQKNRNPFIDNPTWVDRINFQTMTYIPDGNSPTISITAPTVNATWVNGKTYNLTWSSQNVDTVVIQYQKNAVSPFVDYAVVAAANGTYPVLVNFENSTTAKFKLVYKSFPTIQATSPIFSVVTPTVQLTAPVAGAKLLRGTFAKITWTSQHIDTLVLQYQNEVGGLYVDLAELAAATGNHNYFVDFYPAEQARFRLMDKTDTAKHSTSGVFSVVNAEIKISAPTQDDILETNKNVWIKWTKSNVDTVMVKIYSSNGTDKDSLIVKSMINDSVMVTIPVVSHSNDVYIEVVEQNANKNASFIAFDTVSFRISLPDGVAENNVLNSKIKVYPVPSKGNITIEPLMPLNVLQVVVTDLFGRQVYQGNQLSFNLTNKGVYLLHIKTDKGMAVKKLVIE